VKLKCGRGKENGKGRQAATEKRKNRIKKKTAGKLGRQMNGSEGQEDDEQNKWAKV